MRLPRTAQPRRYGLCERNGGDLGIFGTHGRTHMRALRDDSGVAHRRPLIEGQAAPRKVFLKHRLCRQRQRRLALALRLRLRKTKACDSAGITATRVTTLCWPTSFELAEVVDEAFFRKYKAMPESTKKQIRKILDAWDDDE